MFYKANGRLISMAQQMEARLINEYVMSTYPNDLQWRRVRIGPVPTKEDARMYKTTLRWVDAIVLHNNTVLIIEGKVRPELGARSQIEMYMQLFRSTPEFSAYWEYPMKGVLVTCLEDILVKNDCNEHGIDYVVYKPMWINEYLNKLARVGQV